MSAIAPLAIGATIGAMPLMVPVMAITVISSWPLKLSAAMEREITMPPAPPTPCINRKAINISMLVENATASDARKNSVTDKISGLRRPYLSLSGPSTSCPAAKPIILAVKPMFTTACVESKCLATSPRIGPSVLLIRGANAVNAPNSTNKKIL